MLATLIRSERVPGVASETRQRRFRRLDRAACRPVGSRTAGVSALLVLGGCRADSAMIVPPPPPGFVLPAEDPLGTTAAIKRDRLIVRVGRTIGPAYPPSSEQTYLAPAHLSSGQLRRYYDAHTRPGGWATLPVPSGGLRAGEAEFGYVARGYGFAVIVQPPLSTGGKRPVTIVTFAPRKRP